MRPDWLGAGAGWSGVSGIGMLSLSTLHCDQDTVIRIRGDQMVSVANKVEKVFTV